MSTMTDFSISLTNQENIIFIVIIMQATTDQFYTNVMKDDKNGNGSALTLKIDQTFNS